MKLAALLLAPMLLAAPLPVWFERDFGGSQLHFHRQFELGGDKDNAHGETR